MSKLVAMAKCAFIGFVLLFVGAFFYLEFVESVLGITFPESESCYTGLHDYDIHEWILRAVQFLSIFGASFLYIRSAAGVVSVVDKLLLSGLSYACLWFVIYVFGSSSSACGELIGEVVLTVILYVTAPFAAGWVCKKIMPRYNMKSKNYNEVITVTTEERRAAWRAFAGKNKLFLLFWGSMFLYFGVAEAVSANTVFLKVAYPLSFISIIFVAVTMEFCKFCKIPWSRSIGFAPRKMYDVAQHPLFPKNWKHWGVFFVLLLDAFLLLACFILVQYVV